MKQDMIDLYYENLQKLRNGEISHTTWGELCAGMLVVIMTDVKNEKEMGVKNSGHGAYIEGYTTARREIANKCGFIFDDEG